MGLFLSRPQADSCRSGASINWRSRQTDWSSSPPLCGMWKNTDTPGVSGTSAQIYLDAGGMSQILYITH